MPVHVTETITVEEGRVAGAPSGWDDVPPREVFRPDQRSGATVRAESLRVTDAEVLDGREVFAIYRPGRGLETRDVVG